MSGAADRVVGPAVRTDRVDTLIRNEAPHWRGAYTGADRDRPGLFRLAHEGTLFLDEVGDTSPAMQAKLLQVLDSGEHLLGLINTVLDIAKIEARGVKMIAFSGHSSWQQKQVTHRSISTWGKSSGIDRAWAGHCSTQVPQAVQPSGSAWGASRVLLSSIS